MYAAKHRRRDACGFSIYESLSKTLIIGVLAYVSLVLMLRVSGKRTLSKMNAFDLVVTVAFGSCLATATLSNSVSLADVVLAFAELIVLQMIVAWSATRSATVRRLIKAEPSLLFYRGEFLKDVLKAERVAEDEILSAVRSQGLGDLELIEAVVLETDGSFSVIPQSSHGSGSALEHVSRGHRHD
jgi:uncharacterized membrane protein YcaP (DUF421 family)